MITVNGLAIHRAELHVPFRGCWTLEVAFSGTEVPSGQITVIWDGVELTGRVDPTHRGVFAEEVVIRVVGGFGWSTELPATWYQSDNPGVQGRNVARLAAQAAGEVLLAATGMSEPPATLFRGLRVSYSRSRQTAGRVLEDTLAPGSSWWVDFGGATRVGTRPPPAALPRIVLLEYDPASGWAELDVDSPRDLVGATIPADETRGTPALLISEIVAWAGADGFRCRASVAAVSSSSSSRLFDALQDLVRSMLPELPALELRRARIAAQAADGRVSLQQVDRSGELADFGRTEGAVRLYSGSAGISAELETDDAPETILAFTRADWSDPISFLAAPLGQPGHVPRKSLHEASAEIRMVANSAGIVRVGFSDTFPVVLAPQLQPYLVALEVYLENVHVILTPLAALLPDGGAAYNASRAARLSAAQWAGLPNPPPTFNFIAATRLEAN